MGDSMTLLQLLHCIRAAGVRDPNVEMFAAVLESRNEDLEKALADGADPNMTDNRVVSHYRVLLSTRCPEQLRAWDTGEPENGGTVM